MKNVLAWTAAAAALLAATSAKAQTYYPDYPVCEHVYTRGGGYITCSFTSIEQCKLSASGLAAVCYVNPFYARNEPPARKPRRRAPSYAR